MEVGLSVSLSTCLICPTLVCLLVYSLPSVRLCLFVSLSVYMEEQEHVLLDGKGSGRIGV